MHILAPLISGKENDSKYIDAVTKGAYKVTVLQIIDRDFMNKTSTAMGEVMHFSQLMHEVKKSIGQKRKTCQEITEWGSTVKKILGISLIQQVDKVVLINQKNKFFEDIVKDLKKNKIKFELIDVE